MAGESRRRQQADLAERTAQEAADLAERRQSAPMIDNPLGGRSLPEWVGSSPDARVPPHVRDRIFLRAKGRCHLSGRRIMPGELWDLDHVQALTNGGEHRETNLAPALRNKHREKTAEDVALKSKAYRLRAKHTGSWPKSSHQIRSRGFDKSPRRREGEQS